MHKERILYLDLLRIVAIFCVVMIHTCAVPWRQVPVSDLDWQILNVYDSAMRFCVPVFMMISGTLFLDPSRDIQPRRLFTHNILRVAVAFAVWSVAYAGASFVLHLLRGEPVTLDYLFQLLRELLVGHYHMWFLFAIIGLYLITPFLRLITPNKRLTEYFLLLCLVFGWGANLLTLLPAVGDIFEHILSKISLTFGYAGYFVLGDYLHRHGVKGPIRHTVYLLGGLSVVATAVGTAYLSNNAQEPVTSLYNYSLLTTTLAASAVFLFFKQHAHRIPQGPRAQAFIARLSSLTFGIYLVHDFGNVLLSKVDITAVSINPLFGVPLLSVGIFAASALIAWGMSKLPFSRYIM